ncbi:MAG: FtsW/RodA/SpoVE family cell cycle protein [Oscillospiraceae bacterium]|jgi:rod shape determining protein RodA|nr:FtsW/RodA/SpoVE family cell cycle protein [Oscillospiraceae bacterium]
MQELLLRVLEWLKDYFRRLNKPLILLCLLACAFSVVLLYTLCENEVSPFVKPRHYKMQIAMTSLGTVFALILSGINYRSIAKLWYIYAPAALLLVTLLFTPLGITVAGADDIGWLSLGFTSIQPSEFLKIAFILSFSYHISKIGERIATLPHLLLLCVHGAIPVGLIALTGDDGTALVFAVIFVFMLFAAGVRWRYVILGVAAVPAFAFVVWRYIMKPHQQMRFLVIYDPTVREEQVQNLFYQQYKSLAALGTGGLKGTGLIGGDYVYVSEIQTDFIFAYIGNALGFLGCAATAVLLATICFMVLYVAYSAKDTLGRMVCIGVFTMLFVHSFINIGMVIAVFPVVGIPLPFISAGGSSLLALYLCIGLVMSVYSHREVKRYMFSTKT